jgi:hypothetical protein
MREIVLDTYYGEGPMDTTSEDWPDFKHIYFKVCEGAYGYITAGNDAIRETTRQIALESVGMDTIGIYHYPRRHDYVHWQAQAEEYLRQCDALDKMGVHVDYDVIDIERRNIVNADGKYPSQFGSWAYEIYRFVSERTQRPYLRYHDPYSEVEAFVWYGYEWYKELPWICAQYPTRGFFEQIWDDAVDGVSYPSIRNAARRPVMWQVYDTYPAGDWFPQSRAADVNVWLEDWRVVLNKPTELSERSNALRRFIRGHKNRRNQRSQRL